MASLPETISGFKLHVLTLVLTEIEGSAPIAQNAASQLLGFTQPLTEMSTRNFKIMMFLGSKVRPVRKADNLTAIYEAIV
jgi:hypothetical protein